jgi:hypothetical protein
MNIITDGRKEKNYKKRFDLNDWTDKEIYQRFRFTREAIQVIYIH